MVRAVSDSGATFAVGPQLYPDAALEVVMERFASLPHGAKRFPVCRLAAHMPDLSFFGGSGGTHLLRLIGAFKVFKSLAGCRGCLPASPHKEVALLDGGRGGDHRFCLFLRR